MNKNKIIAGIIVVLVVFGAISWLRPAQKDEVAIGAILSLTGPSASFGERTKNGIDLAIEDIEAEKDQKIKVIYEDDKGEAAPAVSAARKLIDQDHVGAIIGSPKSDPTLAIAPIANEKKVILFSPTAGAASITDAGDYIFRNVENPRVHGETASDYLKEKGVKNVALFTAQASNAQGYGKAFRESFESKGGTISFSVEYNPAATDFRTDIAKAKDVDAFYVGVATGKDVGILVRQIRESGYRGIIMVSLAADSKEFFDAAGTSADGTLITSPAFDASAHADYVKKFKERYGTESDWVSANAYDATMLLSDAIDKCGTKETVCIKEYLYSVKDYDGIGGKTTFDRNGDVLKPVLVKEAKGGKFEVVKP